MERRKDEKMCETQREKSGQEGFAKLVLFIAMSVILGFPDIPAKKKGSGFHVASSTGQATHQEGGSRASDALFG